MESYLAELRPFQDVSREQFIREPALHHLAEHTYLEIDHGRVYDAIREDLGDFEVFAAAMSRFL